jgi:SAM-dependent methyltransferase
LTFLIATTGCFGVGLELSPSAIRVGYSRAAELGIQGRFDATVADLNQPLRFEPGEFSAVLAVDVVLHLRDRQALFSDIARLLQPGSRFLFTDAGVITGAVSNDELQRRSVHGYTQFAPVGWNERLLEAAGLRLLETENRTESVVRNAMGRLTAMRRHRGELERLSGMASFEQQAEYLTTVAELAQRNAVSRNMYLAEVREQGVGKHRHRVKL